MTQAPSDTHPSDPTGVRQAAPGPSELLATEASSIGGAIRAMFAAVRCAWWPRLAPRYGLDTRSLALFRVGVGLLLLIDLFFRSLDIRAFYTDEGIVPRERLLGAWGSPLNYSFHAWGGDTLSQAVLFIVAAILALMLLVGYKTRLAAFLSWLFLVSLQGRNYLVLQGGDDMLRVMLFWSIFLPLGTRASVDAVLAPIAADATTPPSERPVVPRRVFSLASMVIVLQLFAIYVVTAHLKSGPAWHEQGSAIHLALHHHTFVTHFGRWFAQLPTFVLQDMTWGIWWLELLGPFLFFIPWRTGYFRTLQVLFFWGFHFGLFMCMELGPFPWVAIVSWSVVLPSWFWDVPVAAVWRSIRSRVSALGGLLRGVPSAVRRLTNLLPAAWEPRQALWWPATLLLLFLASYTAYGTVYAAAHRGGVQGKIFDPLVITRLYANWGMFAPNPPNASGWFVTVAHQANGHEIDVWNDGKPVSWDQPELPSTTYKRERWRKFSDNILAEHHSVVRPYFLGWLCTEWNEQHTGGEVITRIELYHMVQVVHWPQKGYFPLEKKLLQRHQCKGTTPAPPAAPSGVARGL